MIGFVAFVLLFHAFLRFPDVRASCVATLKRPNRAFRLRLSLLSFFKNRQTKHELNISLAIFSRLLVWQFFTTFGTRKTSKQKKRFGNSTTAAKMAILQTITVIVFNKFFVVFSVFPLFC